MKPAQDLGFALRALRKSPAHTIVMLSTMALGVGLNSAMFSIVDAVMLRPLPYRNPDRLVSIWETQRGSDRRMALAGPNFDDLRGKASFLEGLAGYQGGESLVTGGSSLLRVPSYLVSSDFFRVMGVSAEMGRLFSAEESAPGGSHVAVIGHGLWQSALGGSTAALGKTITVFGWTVEVIGVLPEGFAYPQGAGVYIPDQMWPMGPVGPPTT